MNRKSLFLMALVTAVVIAAAVIITQQRSPQTGLHLSPLFPGLLDRLNEVSRVEIRSADRETRLVLRDGDWVIENRGGYPALFERVKVTSVNIAELQILEPKTSNPELYPRLGVEEVDTPGAASILVRLADSEDGTLAALLVGQRRPTPGVPSMYVRRVDARQSFLVRGQFPELNADPTAWLDSELFHIAGTRVQSLRFEHPGEPAFTVARQSPEQLDLTLDTIPQGRSLRSQAMLNSLATVFEDLRFFDVAARSTVEFPEQAIETEVRTFDGLVARVRSFRDGEDLWSALEFEFDPAAAATESDGVREEAARLSALVSDWVYLLPTFKANMLVRSLDDVTQIGAPGPSTGQAGMDSAPLLPEGEEAEAP